MSVDIFVQRGAGDKRGVDIIDPLITVIPVAIQRGRNELDKQSTAPQSVEVVTVYRLGVRLGQLGKFYDSQTGANWKGKIAGISHTIKDGVIKTKLIVEKPTKFYA